MDPKLGTQIRELLQAHADTYADVLSDHFARHLQGACHVKRKQIILN